MPETAYVLLAGGAGQRVGAETPKQFIRVAGRTILEHSFSALATFAPDARILVVVPSESMGEAQRLLQGTGARVIAGGASRQESAYAALLALREQPPEFVVLHDAARPFLDHRILHEVSEALHSYNAVDVAIGTADTIVVGRQGRIENIPRRDLLYRGQTPQGFRYGKLMQCYEEIGRERIASFTDDCGIYLACHPFDPIRIVEGSEENIKITHAVDLVLADELFRIRQQRLTPNLSGLQLRGRHALVLGGGSGIGAALLEVMKDSGAQARSLSRSTGCDIADAEQVHSAIDQAVHDWGKVDFVVNTAGVLTRAALTDQAAGDVQRQVAVNLLGPLHVAQASHAALKRTRGMLLLFSSSSFTRGRAGYSIYSACKAGVVNLTQALADEWQGDGIRVNCVVPGRTDTSMRRECFPGENQRTLLSSYEVALVTAKVLSTDATGQVVRV